MAREYRDNVMYANHGSKVSTDNDQIQSPPRSSPVTARLAEVDRSFELDRPDPSCSQ